MHSQTAISQIRHQIAPFAPLGDRVPTLRDLFKSQPIETFTAGEAIFWEGDPAGQIFDVLEGVLRVYRILSDGRRAITGFIHPGDVLGVSFQNRYLFTAEAVTEVKIRRFGRGRFFSMINETPALRPQLFAILCDEMSAAQDQMLLLGRKTAEERVVSFLFAIHRKRAEGADIELPMSRQDMADYLGLTMETVSRMMTSLARRGFIVLGPRHTVTLRRLAALREIAGHDKDEADAPASPLRRAVWPN
ncbi:MAG TPA: helix-turn-helix domain-containing protein [Roseiarcus sp.]|nr:helix-turn-helix domain-containing protein [Roseiarcus sp.]